MRGSAGPGRWPQTRGRQGFEVIDPRFVRIVDEELAGFDGTRSKVSLVEIERRVLVRLKQEGIGDLDLPQRITQQYLSMRFAALGHTTKQHKSSTLRRNSGRSNYPATPPGHFAVDVTRCDNLVWDDVYERVYSVEIITIISVPSRVVVACRVVPQSANSLEIALALYDAIRPFSMVVEDTTIDDFRWCGIPASLDIGDNPVTAHASRVRTSRDVTGRHVKPGIAAVSLRADNGKIFLSNPVRGLLSDWQVDFMPSRPGRPVDNGIVERWHDSLQAAYQSFRNGAGFKGRAVHERGRFVGWVGFEPLGSWRELQQHLHRHIAIAYHRNRHGGVKIPCVEDGNFTPLERHDRTCMPRPSPPTTAPPSTSPASTQGDRHSYRQVAVRGWTPPTAPRSARRVSPRPVLGRPRGDSSSSLRAPTTASSRSLSARRANGHSATSATPTCDASAPRRCSATRSARDRSSTASTTSLTSRVCRPRRPCSRPRRGPTRASPVREFLCSGSWPSPRHTWPTYDT